MHLDARRELHDDGHAGRGLMQLPHQLHEGRRGDVGLVGVAEPVLGLVHPRKGDVEIRPDDPRQPFTGLGHVHLSPPNPPAPVRGRGERRGVQAKPIAAAGGPSQSPVQMSGEKYLANQTEPCEEVLQPFVLHELPSDLAHHLLGTVLERRCRWQFLAGTNRHDRYGITLI